MVVWNVATVGIIGIDQDDRIGPLALDQLEIGLGVEAKVVFLAQDVVNDLGVRPGEFVIGRERGEVDQKLGLGESVQNRLDDFSRAVADEDRFRGEVEHPAQLGRNHPILRRVKLKQSPELPGANHFAVEVHQEELGGVRVRQKTRVDLQSQLGNELGERPRAGGMRARLSLEPLDSLDQGQLARAQAGAAWRACASVAGALVVFGARVRCA